MKRKIQILLWLYWLFAMLISYQYSTTGNLPVWIVMPPLLLGAWFYDFTKHRNDNWLRIAGIGAVFFLFLTDFFSLFTDFSGPTPLRIIVQCFSVSSYLFYTGGYFFKYPFQSGYLKKYPIFWAMFLGCQVMIIGYLMQNIKSNETISSLFYTGAVTAFYVSIVNTRTKIPESLWWRLMVGVYSLVISEIFVLLNDFKPSVFSLLLYYIGDCIILTTTALIIRRDRDNL